jgi:hypothetical protein
MNNLFTTEPKKSSYVNPVDEILTLATNRAKVQFGNKKILNAAHLSDSEARKITSRVLLKTLRENHGI